MLKPFSLLGNVFYYIMFLNLYHLLFINNLFKNFFRIIFLFFDRYGG